MWNLNNKLQFLLTTYTFFFLFFSFFFLKVQKCCPQKALWQVHTAILLKNCDEVGEEGNLFGKEAAGCPDSLNPFSCSSHCLSVIWGSRSIGNGQMTLKKTFFPTRICTFLYLPIKLLSLHFYSYQQLSIMKHRCLKRSNKSTCINIILRNVVNRWASPSQSMWLRAIISEQYKQMNIHYQSTWPVGITCVIYTGCSRDSFKLTL